MAMFEYKGVDISGKNVKGAIDAENLQAARLKLRKAQVFPTSLLEKKVEANAERKNSAFSFSIGRKRITNDDIVIMTRQLATLVGAKVPLVEAIQAAMDQTENPAFRDILSDVRQKINEGSALSRALERHARYFSDIYTSMIAAGESSGTLEIVLQRLADYTEKSNSLRMRIKAALTYPMIMVSVATIGVVLIIVFFVPKVVDIFDSMGKTLPPTTQFLLDLSTFIKSNWYIILGVIALAVVLVQRYFRTEKGARHLDSIKINMIVMGRINRFVIISRFSRTLGTLLQGGVPILTAIDIVKKVVANKIFAEVLTTARESISEGKSIATPLKASGQFPPILIHMIGIGEKTATLDVMLENVAKSYDEQVDNMLAKLTASLEPLILLFMAVVILFIAISVFVPITKIGDMGGM